MKLEIVKSRPDRFTGAWPGEYSCFSHFEQAAMITGQVIKVSGGHAL